MKVGLREVIEMIVVVVMLAGVTVLVESYKTIKAKVHTLEGQMEVVATKLKLK